MVQTSRIGSLSHPMRVHYAGYLASQKSVWPPHPAWPPFSFPHRNAFRIPRLSPKHRRFRTVRVWTSLLAVLRRKLRNGRWECSDISLR